MPDSAVLSFPSDSVKIIRTFRTPLPSFVRTRPLIETFAAVGANVSGVKNPRCTINDECELFAAAAACARDRAFDFINAFG